ncbi:DUF2610 domain-containing protein [Silvibacterium acidisoli]|uniref:DUF2610 domain-containing protein n=1 Tax=Acidobacteriaceae bacterium ZG23-2 TaxID=2883246 RepID=UPI00406D40C7
MTATARLPYPGLRAFTREESDVFFGRDGCVDAMVNQLAATRFLAVLGSSGSGKSSLVRTGLLDALDLGLHPWAGSRWTVVDFHPGSHPLRNLAAALLTATEEHPPEAAAIDLLASFLRRGPRSLAEWVAGSKLGRGTNLLLLVDQFEELFRYGNYARQEEAEAFVSLLLESSTLAGIDIHIVVTMRSEFLGASALMPGLAEKINAGLYLTPRMTRDECREAIEGPAGVMGFTVEPALVNRLLNDLGSFASWEIEDPGADQAEKLARRADQLPLMQHVLNRLWARAARESGGSAVVLRLSDYDSLGGLSGAVDAHGEEILSTLGAARIRNVETVFRSLVSGTGVAAAVRRPCRFLELVEVTGDRSDVTAIVEAFSASDCNFLRTSEQVLSDEVIVDISHESLIRQWSPLRAWLENEARAVAAWRRLAAAEERYAKREGDLLVGLELQNLAAWWESASPNPAWVKRQGGQFEQVRSFLTASREAEAQRLETARQQEITERNRLRGFVAGLAIALAIFVLLGILDYRSIQRLKETKANLVAESAEASKARDEAKQQRDAAQSEVRRTAAVLKDVSDTVQRYKGVVGASDLESALMKTLAGYQMDMYHIHPETVTASDIARDDYRRGQSFETVGDANEALTSYSMAFDEGRKAIAGELASHHPIPEPLLTNFINTGTRYAWFLFDIGEDSKGADVLREMTKVADIHHPEALSYPLLIAYSRRENSEARYAADHNEANIEKLHSLTAVNLAKRALAASDSDKDIDTRYFTITTYRNRSRDAEGSEKQYLAIQACRLADQLFTTAPSDSRSIQARIECLMDQARDVRVKGDYDQAKEKVGQAEEIARIGLKMDPKNQALLLDMARFETFLAETDSLEADKKSNGLQATQVSNIQFAHAIAAKEYMVRALSGRTLFQSNTTELRNLYDSCCNSLQQSDFPNQAIELEFYRDIAEAIAPTLNAFPKAPSFAYVAAEVSAKIAGMLKDDPAQRKEAIAYLSSAIAGFDKAGVMNDTSSFSEDYAAYCSNYSERAKLYAAEGKVELVQHDIARVKKVCSPVLARYPWDIYLRESILESDRVSGQSLFEAHRYKEALPIIESASYWGDIPSTKLLSRMYQDGFGVSKDAKKAAELDSLSEKQILERFTIPADFSGVKAPFNVYIRDWPPEYPYEGIDDQVIWLKQARGGTFPAAVIESFHKLQKIAKDNKVSFRELTIYAFNAATDKDKTVTAATDEKAQPNERAKTKLVVAQTLIKEEKWAEAAQDLEEARKLDPSAPNILELEVGILHDKLFQFDRAFELNAQLVESGGGIDDFVESHLTTSRFEACSALATLDREKTADKQMRLVMTALDFACLSADQRRDAALAEGHRLRTDVAELEKSTWSFAGTKRYITESPAFAQSSTEWVGLFDALEAGDKNKAQAELTALGIPQ